MATQPDREIELSQINRGVGGVCVGVVPRVQSKLSRALHAHLCAMAFVECLGFSQEDAMEGLLWRETLGRSLGSHDATELFGGM